jgi:hypothetical protein
MVVDNMLTTHGRAPFRGARRTLVAMAEPVRADQVERSGVAPVAG